MSLFLSEQSQFLWISYALSPFSFRERLFFLHSIVSEKSVMVCELVIP